MIAQSDTIQGAAIEALKQVPGILACLILLVLFIRYISRRDANDLEERKAARDSQDKLSDSVNKLAMVVERLKK